MDREKLAETVEEFASDGHDSNRWFPLAEAARRLLQAEEVWWCGLYHSTTTWDTERDECGLCASSVMSCGGEEVLLVPRLLTDPEETR